MISTIVLNMFPALCRYLALTVLLLPSIVWACSGAYQGKSLSASALQTILEANPDTDLCGVILDGENLTQMNLHGARLAKASMVGSNLSQSDLSQADLQGADLSQVIFDKTYLRWANLTHTRLGEAKINKSNFMDTQLENADFSRARVTNSLFNQANLKQSNFTLVQGQNLNFEESDLQMARFDLAQIPNSQFSQSNLSHAIFKEAQLKTANFAYANLSHTHLQNADLTEADFSNANLSHTNFQRADLNQAKYFPTLEGLPELSFLATAKNIRSMHFYKPSLGSPAISALQTAYKKAGIRPMERLLTSMIKEQQMRENIAKGGMARVGGYLSYIFFYVTCEFGLSPSKPLALFLMLTLVLSLPYYLSLGAHSPHSGIIVGWPSRRDPHYMLEASYQHFVKIHATDAFIIRIIKHYRRFSSALYFSVLSSFKIGWQDFNLAVWITQIQTKDYSFIARGWVRSLAGIQSIISAYLIVLWVLTYFGRPFEW